MAVTTIDGPATGGRPATRTSAPPTTSTGSPPVPGGGPAPTTPTVDDATDSPLAATSDPNTLSGILRDFGIEYPDAPKPTPAFLAFVRGLGLQLSTAEDNRRIGVGSVNARSADSAADLYRTAGRNKENVTADMIRRGVLRSGEANTRYTRAAEDVSAKEADIARNRTEGISAIEQAYQGVKGSLGQQALEKTLNLETDIATREASTRAQEEAWKRQQEQDALNYERQRKANDEMYARQIALMREQYGV